MTQAIVSPAELRRFAAELRRYATELKGSTDRLHSQFRQLGETWRDQEQKKFEHEFTQTSRVIQQFIQAAERYHPFLVRKAEAAEEYLRRGL
jgi:uncharacterized protein YukE